VLRQYRLPIIFRNLPGQTESINEASSRMPRFILRLRFVLENEKNSRRLPQLFFGCIETT
jgi:hypothetical protein